MSVNKVFSSAREAIFDVKDGSSIVFGGPGGIHNAPTSLIWALKVHRGAPLIVAPGCSEIAM